MARVCVAFVISFLFKLSFVRGRYLDPPVEVRGQWNLRGKCPADTYVHGISVLWSDSSTVSGLRFHCVPIAQSKTETTFTLNFTNQSATFKWSDPVFCDRGVAAGVQLLELMEFETTTASNVALICSDETLLFDARQGVTGIWSMPNRCNSQAAICATQAEVVSNGNNAASLATMLFDCCAIAHPAQTCNTTDTKELLVECDNKHGAFTPLTCGYSKKVGISFKNAMEEERSVYEDLGFDLSSAATYLLAQSDFGPDQDQVPFVLETTSEETVNTEPGFEIAIEQVVLTCGFYTVHTNFTQETKLKVGSKDGLFDVDGMQADAGWDDMFSNEDENSGLEVESGIQQQREPTKMNAEADGNVSNDPAPENGDKDFWGNSVETTGDSDEKMTTELILESKPLAEPELEDKTEPAPLQEADIVPDFTKPVTADEADEWDEREAASGIQNTEAPKSSGTEKPEPEALDLEPEMDKESDEVGNDLEETAADTPRPQENDNWKSDDVTEAPVAPVDLNSNDSWGDQESSNGIDTVVATEESLAATSPTTETQEIDLIDDPFHNVTDQPDLVRVVENDDIEILVPSSGTELFGSIRQEEASQAETEQPEQSNISIPLHGDTPSPSTLDHMVQDAAENDDFDDFDNWNSAPDSKYKEPSLSENTLPPTAKLEADPLAKRAFDFLQSESPPLDLSSIVDKVSDFAVEAKKVIEEVKTSPVVEAVQKNIENAMKTVVEAGINAGADAVDSTLDSDYGENEVGDGAADGETEVGIKKAGGFVGYIVGGMVLCVVVIVVVIFIIEKRGKSQDSLKKEEYKESNPPPEPLLNGAHATVHIDEMNRN